MSAEDRLESLIYEALNKSYTNFGEFDVDNGVLQVLKMLNEFTVLTKEDFHLIKEECYQDGIEEGQMLDL